MVIQTLTPDDAAEYTALRREMLADAPWAFSASPEDDQGLDPAFIAARLRETGQAIIGARDAQQRLVGAAGLVLSNRLKMVHRARIWGVYVSPIARRRGVGRAIMWRTLEIARTWPGVTSVGLSASVRSTGAIAMYQSLGFVPWGTEPGCIMLDGKLYDEVHMVASLVD